MRRPLVSVSLRPAAGVIAGDLRGFGNDVKSLREPLKRSIQTVLAPSFRRNFTVGGRPTWKPLAEYTVQDKGHSRPLVRSGALKRISGQLNLWTIDGPGGRAFIRGFPQGVWYGTIHQTGVEGIRTIPARPFLVAQREDVERIHKVFRDYAAERARRRRLA